MSTSDISDHPALAPSSAAAAAELQSPPPSSEPTFLLSAVGVRGPSPLAAPAPSGAAAAERPAAQQPLADAQGPGFLIIKLVSYMTAMRGKIQTLERDLQGSRQSESEARAKLAELCDQMKELKANHSTSLLPTPVPVDPSLSVNGIISMTLNKVCVCGCVGVWVCGCVGVWVCGCVFLL